MDLSQTPVRPRQLRPELPPELERILFKLLGKKPGNRYSSAAALREDLIRLNPRSKPGRSSSAWRVLKVEMRVLWRIVPLFGCIAGIRETFANLLDFTPQDVREL